MRRLAIRSAAAPAWHTVLVIVLMALVGLPLAHALDVVRSQRALADVPTRLAPAPGAPSTTLRPQQPTGGLTPRTQDTTLQRNAGPQTILREAEVPKERLEQTRALLVELKARPTPEQAISIDLPADVLFDFDKADLRADAGPSLDKAAELIKSYASAPLTVLGHTDGKGTDAYNDALSLRRAEAVAAVVLVERIVRILKTEVPHALSLDVGCIGGGECGADKPGRKQKRGESLHDENLLSSW